MKNRSNCSDRLNFLINRIDNEITKKSLLKHKFYTLWSDGKLTLSHLRGYSKEYFQLVKTVPELVNNIYNIIEKHGSAYPYLNAVKKTQIEEADHIEPWVKFALSLGLEKKELVEYAGSNEVNMAIDNLRRLSSSSITEGLSTMYAFEKELPKISSIKIEGLQKFYGISKEEALRYFRIHEIADIEHAELWKTIMLDPEITNINDNNTTNLILQASAISLDAQNQILDSVYNTYVEDTII